MVSRAALRKCVQTLQSLSLAEAASLVAILPALQSLTLGQLRVARSSASSKPRGPRPRQMELAGVGGPEATPHEYRTHEYRELVLAELRRLGPTKARPLLIKVGGSPQRLRNAMAELEAGAQVTISGRARGTTYAPVA